MDYLRELKKIEQALTVLDNALYDTIEEANKGVIKYDRLKNDIISILSKLLDDQRLLLPLRDSIYSEVIILLVNYIGSADDIKKYGDSIISFYNEGKISKLQMDSFFYGLDINRWV